jgi:hypothetical protein
MKDYIRIYLGRPLIYSSHTDDILDISETDGMSDYQVNELLIEDQFLRLQRDKSTFIRSSEIVAWERIKGD